MGDRILSIDGEPLDGRELQHVLHPAEEHVIRLELAGDTFSAKRRSFLARRDTFSAGVANEGYGLQPAPLKLSWKVVRARGRGRVTLGDHLPANPNPNPSPSPSPNLTLTLTLTPGLSLTLTLTLTL